jgi:hypothetical protein
MLSALSYGDPTLIPLPFLPFEPDSLQRTTAPAASEISAWTHSRLDLLKIEIVVTDSPEFFANG